ncbi:putative N-acetylmannosamine-6-phosphate 2-epimerase [[Clostridium] ultunense Esp]|nr:putative N-acetylmannosamine-6-phosphate 2-epimerase [[Clostridium] ultunense Esp]
MNIREKIKGGLIVSCQALPQEPLHSPIIMGKMALAAKMGGAVGIRGNGIEDIRAIQDEVDLPVIGLIKREYPNSSVYITPTLKEVQELIDVEVELIAIDSTFRGRPNGERLEDLYRYIRDKSKALIVADISTLEEAKRAEYLGADFISTTLAGYTEETKERRLPDLSFLEVLVRHIHNLPILAEGGIMTPEQAGRAIEIGAFAVVVGSAITRPQVITKVFVDSITRQANRSGV